uniref:NADAR domain-containing protein n=1 Tax=viral metagenome TaxID=1070528 RepID=A0A6C0D2T5_9ZZZZ
MNNPIKILEYLGKLGYIIEQNEEEQSSPIPSISPISPISPISSTTVIVPSTTTDAPTTSIPTSTTTSTTTSRTLQRPEFFIKFWSRGTDLKKKEMKKYNLPANTPKLLSNFAETPVEWNHHMYPTVEHAFQGAKYLFSTLPSFEKEFRIDESIGLQSPTVAKTMGSKTGMKKNKAVLNIVEWDSQKNDIMQQLIQDKIKRHDSIRSILRSCHEHHIPLFHYSKDDRIWGCIIDEEGNRKEGDNLLGKLFMDWTMK